MWKMIYLISQVTFIFTIIFVYKSPKFTVIWISSHRHQITSQDFRGTLRSISTDCFWRTILCSTQKMHISEYVCKTYLKELGILLECREIFEKFLAASYSSKNTGLTQFFFQNFLTTAFKNISFLTKSKRCLLCSKLPEKLVFLTSKTAFTSIIISALELKVNKQKKTNCH